LSLQATESLHGAARVVTACSGNVTKLKLSSAGESR
jgi:hypothetical protein